MIFLVNNPDTSLGIGDIIRKSLDTFMDDNVNTIFSYSDTVLSAVIGIAFCGAVVRIFQNYYDSPDNYLGYLSYVPLLAFLLYYGDIAQGIYELGSNAGSSSTVRSGVTNIFYRVADYQEADINILTSPVSFIMNELKVKMYETSVRFVLIGASIASALCYIYLKFKIVIKLMVLVFFGPINISLSFIPSVGNLWVGWLIKVIELSLYIPTLYFIEYMNDRMLETAFKPQLITDVSDAAQSIANGYYGIAFYVITIFTYLSIPKVVSWAMNTSTSNFGGVSGVVTKAAMLAAKVKTGGVA